MIHLARSIEQAWRRTVEGSAVASGDVSELGRLTANVQLDAEMGGMALQMLERVLCGEFEGFDPWQRAGPGEYRRELEGVTMVYHADTHQLTIESQLTELVTAEARGAAEASGFTVGEVAVDAVGRYYSDGWGGRTRERALDDAQKLAEKRVADAIENLHRQQNAEQLAAAEEQAQAEAEALAAQELEQLQAQTRDALRERLQIILAQAEERVYHVMNRAVGEAYRQTLRQLVLDNGGRILMDEQTGSVINMELELY
jgi:hypothetical protein